MIHASLHKATRYASMAAAEHDAAIENRSEERYARSGFGGSGYKYAAATRGTSNPVFVVTVLNERNEQVGYL